MFWLICVLSWEDNWKPLIHKLKLRNFRNTPEHIYLFPLFHLFSMRQTHWWFFFKFYFIEEIMAGLWGCSRTEMRGLWRCPQWLSYALAGESGLCSGTETVFSTGLWWISVHLDNRGVRSLGWHSTSAGQQLTHGSWSLVLLFIVIATL